MTHPGFVLLDKPAGDTSFKALFPLKRLFGTRRIGHAGTLDLRASGLIIAAVERATRLLPFIEVADKTYRFKLHLGFETDTLEWDGKLLFQGEAKEITEESLKQILPDFLGEQEQVPPNYSAIKINGVRASDLTHRGRNVTLSSRKIRIDSLVCLGKSSTQLEETGKSFAVFDMECRCSKGTYIRALCRDLGHALGTYGCVSEIRRTAIGNISVENAVLPSELSLSSLLSVDKILPYPLFRLHENQIKALRDGKWISFKSESAKEESLCFAANENGMVQALCSLEPGKLRPKFFIGQDNE
ncbi:MAG: tRNA pseudouridine(55) synthase TruB [Fibrobacteraceae bacterium]|nr:tRNA pseudouridine(55) synthase TruB [Fibrobacteraceae bacterium]